jgi:hypothetical protein
MPNLTATFGSPKDEGISAWKANRLPFPDAVNIWGNASLVTVTGLIGAS